MSHVSRRLFCGSALGLSAAALAGCTVGTNSVTINVAALENYAQAGLNFVTLVLPEIELIPGLPAAVIPAIQAVTSTLQTSLNAFETTAGTSITLSVNLASVKTAVTSIYQDVQSIYTQVAGVLTTAIQAKVQQYLTAMQTVISLLSAIYDTVINKVSATATQAFSDQIAGKPMAAAPMSEQNALQVLGVTA